MRDGAAHSFPAHARRVRRAGPLVALAGALACGGKSPPPSVPEPPITEVAVDAGPAPEPADAAPPRPETLYDRLGGKEGVTVITSDFAKRLVVDPRVAKLFTKSADGLARFRQMFADQLCALTGGGCLYAGKSMSDAHKGLGITDTQFDAFIEDLGVALRAHGVSEADASDIFVALAPMKGDVVEKKRTHGETRP